MSYSSEASVGHLTLPRQSTADFNEEGAQPRKLNFSSAETPSYQNLHRELLLSHKRYCRSHVRALISVWSVSESGRGRVECVLCVSLADHAGACCWRRNLSWSVCWSSADWSCTKSRRWPSGVPQTWRQSCARGSRSWRRSEMLISTKFDQRHYLKQTLKQFLNNQSNTRRGKFIS